MNNLAENIKNAEIRHGLELKYTTARMNLLLVLLFTAINIVLLFTKQFIYFLFSATIPYYLVDIGMFLCGFYPPEAYVDGGYVGVEFWDSGFLITVTVIAAVLLLAYLACFIFSRNMNGGWLIAALVLFSVDTAGMFFLYGFATDMIVDIVFHAWVIYELVVGIIAYNRMKAVPIVHLSPEDMLATDENGESHDSVPLRTADMSAKSRTFLDATAHGHTVAYRRVGKTNELVIDGRVYDEYTAMMEFPHTLAAVIDGHVFEAGIGSNSRMILRIDGETVASKIRII